MTATNDRCTAMTPTNDRCTAMTATNTTGVSAAPAVPAVAAAPPHAANEVLAAPVPPGAVPTVVVPAIVPTKPDELRALDYI
jgi:hypothetical protein